jgi:hypothetical protein
MIRFVTEYASEFSKAYHSQPELRFTVYVLICYVLFFIIFNFYKYNKQNSSKRMRLKDTIKKYGIKI